MGKKLQKIIIIAFVITGLNLRAAETIPSDAIDYGSNEFISLNSTGYMYGMGSGTLIEHTGEYNFYSSLDTSPTCLYIMDGAGEQEISFWGIQTTNYYGALVCQSHENTTLNMQGDNNFVCTGDYGFAVLTLGDTDDDSIFPFTIKGDSLTLNNEGGNYSLSSVNDDIEKVALNINLNYLYLSSAVSTKAGIGAPTYPLGKLSIADDCILTGEGNIYADTIIIDKASIKIASLSSPAINSLGDTVYCVTIPRSGSNIITVSSGINNTSEVYSFTSAHPNDDNYYIYLPNGFYEFSNGDGYTYTATIDGKNVTAALAPIAGDGYIDVSEGTVVISEDEYFIGVQPYTYTGRSFVLSGTTTENTVTIDGGADSITLKNVRIQLSTNACAFNIATGNNLSLVLEGSNTLISGLNYAGLQKTFETGSLVISGSDVDTLVATGSGYGSGIGSGYDSVDCENITITGGAIIATGFTGIGSSFNGTAKYITITGGQVSANGTYSAIGGHLEAGFITISGGVVVAKSNAGTGIGAFLNNKGLGNSITGGFITAIGGSSGKALAEGVSISGGTVYTNMTITAEDDFSYKYRYAFVGGSITGGSVNLLGLDGETDLYYYDNGITEKEGRPVDADSTLLYRSQYIVPDINEMTLVDSISINGIPWNCNDLYTDIDGSVYLWLPLSEADTVFISHSGNTYSYLGGIVAYDEYVEADESEGITEYGNYLWQVPVTVEDSEQGSIKIATFNDTLITSGLVCYNTDISVWAGSKSEDQLDIIVMNDTIVFSDTTYTIKDSVSFSLYYQQLNYEITISMPQNGTLSVIADGYEISSGDRVDYGVELSITAIANDGYQLDSLVIDSVSSIGSATTVTVSAPVNIAAYFSSKADGSDGTEVDEFTVANIYAYSNEKILYVYGRENVLIRVYNINGVLVDMKLAGGTTTEIPVKQSGLYILKVTTCSGDARTLKCLVE